MMHSHSIASNLPFHSLVSTTETNIGPNEPTDLDEFVSYTDPVERALLVLTPQQPMPAEQINYEWVCQAFTPKAHLRNIFNIMFQHLAQINEQPATHGSIFYLCHSNELGYITFNKTLQQLEAGKPVWIKPSITNSVGEIYTLPERARIFFTLAEMHDWYCEE